MIKNEFLKSLDLSSLKGGGAFYKFININQDDKSFSKELLTDYSVCVVPGTAYGESGKNFIRITFAENLDKVKEGISRIAELLNKIQ